MKQESILDKIRAEIKVIVAEWKSDTWTDNHSYECMVKIAELVDLLDVTEQEEPA